MQSSLRAWTVLAERNFGLFWVSLLVSAVGSQLSNVAIGWQVYELTNSPLQLGLTGLFRAIPTIIFSLTGGVLADRVDRRRLLIVTQSLAMALAFLLSFLTKTGWVQVWHIYAITFLTGTVTTFDIPARMALTPSLVSRENLSMAFALNVTLRQTASLLGPFLAGIIIAWLGLSWSHFLNGVSFLGVVICLITMKVRAAPAERKENAWQSMSAGLRFVRGNSVILGLLLMDTCVSFFGAYRVLMPVFARDLLGVGPTGLGALLGAPAVGALVGSSIIIGSGNLNRAGRHVLWVTLAYTAGLVLFAVTRSFVLSLVINFVIGGLDAVGETLRVTIIQLLTPDDMRGRVQALVHVFVMGIPFLGQSYIGAAASLLGPASAVVLGGVLGALVVGIVAVKLPAIKKFEVEPAV
jgi:MFS family permease